jgi:putative transposase
MEKATPAATATPLTGLDPDWFDPLEDAVRGQVRAFIEQLLEEELEAALGRGRYERDPASKGHRNGHRGRRLDTTFGPLVLAVRGRGCRTMLLSVNGAASCCPPTGV